MTEPIGAEGEELAVVGESHEDLGDRQRDALGVGDPRGPARPAAWRQEIVAERT
jgi:hypothetical protein